LAAFLRVSKEFCYKKSAEALDYSHLVRVKRL
jgi:hypothetical protein